VTEGIIVYQPYLGYQAHKFSSVSVPKRMCRNSFAVLTFPVFLTVLLSVADKHLTHCTVRVMAGRVSCPQFTSVSRARY
jgi:hypothetical protein